MQSDKIKKNSIVIVALSGGPDSVYLLHELKKIEKKLSLKLIGAHLNHGTRFSSDRDERFCEKLCKQLEITFESKKIKLKGAKNLEEAGRIARYEFFDEVKKKYKAKHIATAHHLNDSIETVLLNLTRGCSLNGLTGIQDRSDIIRPLANLKKTEILSYLKKHKIKFVTDATNSQNIYNRNKVRNLIIPILKKINPGLENTFAQNIENFTQVRKFLESLAEDWIKTHGRNFDISEFKRLDQVLQKQILTFIYKEYVGSTAGLTMKQIENTLGIILKNKNLKGDLAGVKFKTEYGKCTFGEKNKNTSMITIYLGGISDPKKLMIRTWLNGDRFQPPGMKGTKKLQDFFTDKKIPKAERHSVPIITYNGEIVAIGDLAVSEKYKAERGAKILQIRIDKKSPLPEKSQKVSMKYARREGNLMTEIF